MQTIQSLKTLPKIKGYGGIEWKTLNGTIIASNYRHPGRTLIL